MHYAETNISSSKNAAKTYTYEYMMIPFYDLDKSLLIAVVPFLTAENTWLI